MTKTIFSSDSICWWLQCRKGKLQSISGVAETSTMMSAATVVAATAAVCVTKNSLH